MARTPGSWLQFLQRGLSGQLFLFIFIPFTLIVLVMAFISQNLHHDAMRSLVGDRDLRTVRTAAAGLERELAAVPARLAGLAKLSSAERSASPEAAFFDGGWMVVDETGRSTTANLPPWAVEIGSRSTGFDPAKPAVLSFAVSQPRPLALASAPLPEGGWLIGAFSLQPFAQTALSDLTDSGAVLLAAPHAAADAPPVFLFSAGHENHTGLIETGITESLAGQSGVNYQDDHHDDQITVFTSLNGLGWGLVLQESWENIATPYLRSTLIAPLLALAPVMLISLAALWYGSRQIVLPLQRLEARTSELAAGKLSSIRRPVGGTAEIQSLQTSLIDMASRLDAARAALRRYIGALTSGVELERRTLARDLHDETIQSLIALKQRIQLARMTAPPDQLATLQDLENQTQAAVTGLRRTIRGLRPIYLEELGLEEALIMLARETEEAAPIQVKLRIEGQIPRLPVEIELSFYRIAQEALNNTLRHARAEKAILTLTCEGRFLQMSIEDNGTGFDSSAGPAGFAREGHFGLLGMSERAELIGAEFTVISSPTEGTRVQVQYPLPR